MNSLWRDGVKLPEFPPLDGDVKTEVVIVGGGIAGILTAYFLQKRGVPYILLERGRICGGVTGNTTAKLTVQHGLIYSKISKSMGDAAAKLYLQSNLAALAEYSALCKEIDCDYEVKDNYVYSTSDRRKLEREMETLLKIGYGARFYESVPIPIDNAGGVCFTEQAQFHPLKFLSAIACGLNIRENTHVIDIDERGVTVAGGRVRAQEIILTTHFPIIRFHGSYYLKQYQHRSYVIALHGAKNIDGMYVDESKTGMSFRNHDGLLLLGGGGHRTGKRGGSYAELCSFAARHYPRAEIKYSWAAQDCMSLDGVPYIGPCSKRTPNLYVATGFNKWGMTGAMTAAMLLADAVTGVENDYAALYSPSRSILHPQLICNGVEAVANLLTLSKRRCPHLGCALKWNPAEHSWDCPCHGSRFDADGKLIDSPSNRDL